jgi:hypothetical protein
VAVETTITSLENLVVLVVEHLQQMVNLLLVDSHLLELFLVVQ